MHDIDTLLLRTFLILAETKNFTRTAERIGRSQSAASMQIAKLEEILGVQLFERDKRHVRLSTDGEKLLGYARQMVSLSEAMVGRFREPEVKGEISFGSPEDFTTFHLPSILANFTKSHPRVMLHVNCDLTLSLIKDFERKRYDLIVIKQEPGNLYPDAQALWRERLVWVGAPDADPSRTFKQVVKDQAALPLIASPSPCVYRARATEALDKSKCAWKVAFSSPSIAGQVAAARAGLGYAALPRQMVPPDLTPLEQEQGWPKLKDAEICLLARDPDRPAIAALSNYIREHITFNQKNK